MFGLSAGYIGSKGKRQGPEVRWDGVGGGAGGLSPSCWWNCSLDTGFLSSHVDLSKPDTTLYIGTEAGSAQ